MTAPLPVENSFPEPGKLFAERYEIKRLIGKGGHSRVYSARQTGFEREVAVKVLNIDRPMDRDSRDTIEKRFYQEARLLSRLRGPNTLRIYDYGRTDSGQLFMISEFIQGTDLKEYMRPRGPLPEKSAQRIFTQILQGLLEVHAEGFLHRDVKPSNIMVYEHLGQRDKVKLLDFGIAKGMREFTPKDAGLTMAGFVIGTPGYMSPEQTLGEPISEASDIFSAGLVAYEMLTGRAPFVGLSSDQMLRSLRAAPLRIPATVEVSKAFADAVHRCLEKDLSKRYQNAQAVLRDLGVGPDTHEMMLEETSIRDNILTFPLEFDPTGTTKIDTLTDAETGQTTAISLPAQTPPLAEPVTAPPQTPGLAVDRPEASETASSIDAAGSKKGVAIVVSLLVIIALALIAYLATRPDGATDTAPEPPVAPVEIDPTPAINLASEVLFQSARNAELDATIAAKEARLADPDVDESAPEPVQADPEPERREPAKQVTPPPNEKKTQPKKVQPRIAEPKKVETKTPPKKEEPKKTDFKVETLDDI